MLSLFLVAFAIPFGWLTWIYYDRFKKATTLKQRNAALNLCLMPGFFTLLCIGLAITSALSS